MSWQHHADERFGAQPPLPWPRPSWRWFACGALLEAAAKAWVVHDVIQPADAIVVLGGGLETRPFAAAALYKNGFTPKILVSDVKPSRAEKLGVVASHVREASSIFLSAVSSARFSSLDFLRDLSAILAEMVAAVGHVDFVITASCVGESTATRSPCTLTEDAAQKYGGCCAEIRSTLYGCSKLVVERMLKEAEAVY